MELILWRHAEAKIGEPDESRALTAKGRRQAGKVAAWLDRTLSSSCRILVSPALRCIQTAEALERNFKIHPGLNPNATAQEILKAANWPNHRDPVLIVGHQPSLGHIASLLLAGTQQDWSIRKGNVWWLSQRIRDDVADTYLKTVITPDLLAK